MAHWHYLLLIIISSGILGGVVNYLMTPIDESKERMRNELIKSIIIGVAAALLVPLFFNTISSNLIEESKDDLYKLFVIAGFCLIASISSKAFIQSISDKVLKDIDRVKDEVKDVQHDMKIIIENDTEQDETDEVQLNIDANLDAYFDESDANMVSILNALAESRFTYRTLKGISKDTGLEHELVKKTLNELISKNYVNQYPQDKGMTFYITSEGRSYLVRAG